MKRFSAFNPVSRVMPQARKAALWLGFVFALLAFASNRANATHAAGADISYKWISGNTYEITVAFYRFCSGVPAPTTVSVNVRSASSGVNFPKVLAKIPGTGLEITYPCGGSTNCNGGSILGIQQYVYRGQVVLPNPATDWVFSYQICCRNCEITTIQHPTPCNTTNTDPQLYVEAKLNSVEAPENSSPSFSLYPVGFICANQPFTFNQGAIDIDGDSLVYSLITPKTSATTNVTFMPGFSSTNPITSSGGTALDGGTGQIDLTPTTVGQIGILAVLVQEYRNGVLISSTIRDMQFSVINCTNSYPSATGVNGSLDYTFTVCPGSTVNFDIFTSDPDAGQNLTLEWNNGILDPDATFTVSAGQPPVGTFNWTTDSSDARTQPYTFVVTVRDNGCNYNQQQSYIFSIYVVNIEGNLTATDVLCAGDTNGSVTASPTGGTAPYTYAWSNGGTDASISGLAPGQYIVTITDSTGCTGIDTANILNQVALTANALVDSNILCFGDLTGQATVTVSGGLAPYTYAWDNGSTDATAIGLGAGTQNVTVTDANGCVATASVNITENLAIVITVSAQQPAGCQGESTGSIDVTVTGGASPYTYIWSTGATTEDIDNLSAGLYDLTVQDVNGCLGATSINVDEPDTIVPLITSAEINGVNILCFGTATGEATVNVTGGTAPYIINWSTGDTTATVTGLSAGIISVTVSDQNGCSNTDTFELTQPLVPFLVTVDTTINPTCAGNNDGSAVLSVSGGTSPYSYAWNNGSTDLNLDSVSDGSYILTVTDADLCTATATVNIAAPLALSVVAQPVDTIDFEVNCNGENSGAINAIVNGGTLPYTYTWSNGSTEAGIGALFAGLYEVTVVDANGCSGYDSITLTQPDTIVPLISSATVTGDANVLCFGDSTATATVDATGGTPPYSYLWSNGATTQTVNNLGAGEITVQVFDQNGCSGTDTFNVTQPPLITPTFNITQLSCNGATDAAIDMTVTGGFGTYTFAWSNGSTDEDLSGLGAGSYTITITDANGCTVSANVDITAPNAFDITADITNIVCGGTPTGAIDVTVDGGTAPYTYSWSNGTTDEDIINALAGSYTVSITDAVGCSTEATFVINETTPITSDFTTTDASCFGLFDASATADVLGGVAPYTYAWSTGDSVPSIANIGAGAYDLTVTDSIGCTAAFTVIVNEPAPISPNALVTNVSFCADSTGAIDLGPSGGTAPYSFQWNVNEAITEDISNLGQGTYTVTITDNNLCAQIDSFTVGLNDSLAVIVDVIQIDCSGGIPGSVSLTVSGGLAPYSFAWSDGSTTSSISVATGGTFDVTITDAQGCTMTASATVDPCCLINITFDVVQPGCDETQPGSIVAIPTGGTAPYTFAWDIGGTSDTLSNLSAGTYTVTVTDSTGCTGSAFTTLANPPIDVTIMQSGDFCSDSINVLLETVTTATSGPFTYLWSNGSTDETITVTVAGTYSVTLTDATGCTGTDSHDVIASNLVLSLTPDSLGCSDSLGNIVSNISGGAAPFNYLWSNGETTTDLIGVAAGTYTLTVLDANGCSVEATASLVNIGALNITVVTSDYGGGANVTCVGNNGSIGITVNNGTAPFTYVWASGETDSSLDSLPGGTYDVTVTDANGCSVAQTIALVEIDTLVLTANVTNVSCYNSMNGGIEITAVGAGVGPFNYSWSTGGFDPILSGLDTGSYSITVTDADGCSAVETYTITQPDTLTATIDVTITDCSSGGTPQAVVNAIGSGGTAPYTYLWSNGNTDQSFALTVGGIYTVTILDANLCEATATTDSISLPVPVTLTLVQTVEIFCGDSSIAELDLTVNTGVAPFTFNWNTGDTTEDLAGLDSGVYTVTVIDANGCSATASELVEELPLPIFPVIEAENTCPGDSTGAASASMPDGLAPFTFSWTGPNGFTSSDSLITGLVTGAYDVTITDANGCSNTNTIIVPGPANFTATFTQGLFDMCGAAPTMLGSLTANLSGGTEPYTIVWDNGTTDFTIADVDTGTYCLTITDANGCTFDTCGVLTMPDSLIVSANDTLPLPCGITTGLVDITVTGGQAPFTYTWSNGDTTEDVIGATAGTYSVTVMDADSCMAFATVEVISQTQLLVDIAIVDSVTCAGGDGALEALVTGGTDPLTYVWSNFGSTDTITGLNAGVYSVTVTDNGGCFGTDTFVLVPANAFTIDIAIIDTPTCTGTDGSVVANVTGGVAPYSFDWGSGPSTDSTLSNLAAGTYTVTVTDATGCSSVGSVNLTPVGGTITAFADITDVANCFGDSTGAIALDITGGTQPYTVLWDNGATDEDIDSIPGGIYLVTITDAAGCTAAFGPYVVAQPAQIDASFTEDVPVACTGLNSGVVTATPNAGVAPFTFLWSNGDTTATADSLVGGATYTITITDSLGCMGVDTFTLTVPDSMLVDIQLTTPVLCNGDSTAEVLVLVTGGTAPYTYLWNDGTSDDTIDSLGTGTYTVTVFDANGCNASDSIVITEPEVLTVSTVGSTILCGNDTTGTVSTLVNGGTGPYLFVWSGNISFDSTLINVGSGVYCVTVTDANLCSAESCDTVVSPNAPINLSYSFGDTLVCSSDCNADVDLIVSGGVAPYGFSWSNGATTEDLTDVCAGTYVVTVTDAVGCTMTTTVDVIAPAAITFTVTVTNVGTCAGNDLCASTGTITGGTAPYTYLWSNAATTSEACNLDASATYTVTVTDANGCTGTGSIAMPAVNQLTVSLDAQNGCDGGAGSITANPSNGTAPFTYAWDNGITATTATVNGLVAGNYCVTVTDNGGCTATACVDITTLPALNVNAGQDQSICNGGANTATLNANLGSANGGAWTVIAGGATVTDPTNTNTGVTGLTAGNNTFVFVGVNGSCTDADTVTIIYNNVSANAGKDTSGCNIDHVHLDATGSGVWSVLTGGGSLSSSTDPNAEYMNPGSGANTLVWTVDTNGCSITDTITIFVQDCDTIIPNGFTPNGDGHNDLFVIGQIGKYPTNDFKVFNRWGNVVFSRSGYNNDWNGSNNDGNPLPDGTYFIVFNGTETNGTKFEYAGYVNLRRQ